MPELLVDDIHTYYGESYVLQGISLALAKGEVRAAETRLPARWLRPSCPHASGWRGPQRGRGSAPSARPFHLSQN
jgi:hypothetical protein